MTAPTAMKSWRAAVIDPARVARASEFQILNRDLDAEGRIIVRVSVRLGPPHWVQLDDPMAPVCDCEDHAQTNGLCKHALAVLLDERDERALLALAEYTPPKAAPAFPEFSPGMRLGILSTGGEWVPVTVIGPVTDGMLTVRPAGWAPYMHMALQLRFVVWGETMKPARDLTFRRVCRACRGLGYVDQSPLTEAELATKPDPCPVCHGSRHHVYDPWKPGKIEQERAA